MDCAADLLERAGYKVTCCTSVEDAMHATKTERFDAAILDINLDGTHVTPLADELHRIHVPFAVCSGHSIDVLPPRHRDVPFITKPYGYRALLATLRGRLLVKGAL